MKELSPSSQPTRAIFGSTTASFVTHLIGALTCASCWAIFGPALALVFGSSVMSFMSAMRPFAPASIVISAFGLGYSILRLVRERDQSGKLPYRLAAAFTLLSIAGWSVSAVFIIITVVKG